MSQKVHPKKIEATAEPPTNPENTAEPIEAPKPKKAPRDKSKPSKKRGPARPYRRLAIDILDKRIAKLTKRIAKARTQLDESEGFLTKYTSEKKYRENEPEGPATVEDTATKIEATLSEEATSTPV